MFVQTILFIVKRSGPEEEEQHNIEEDRICEQLDARTEKLKQPTPAYIIFRYYAFISKF